MIEMKKLVLIALWLLTIPLLAWCGKSTKNVTFQDAYNTFFSTDKLTQEIHKVDFSKPFEQNTQISINASYMEDWRGSLSISLGGSADINNNNANGNIDISFKGDFPEDFFQQLWGMWPMDLESDAMQREDEEEPSIKVYRPGESGEVREIGRFPIEDDRGENVSPVNQQDSFIISQQRIASESTLSQPSNFLNTNNPQQEQKPAKRMSVDIGLAGKVQLNNSWLYALLDRINLNFPNPIMDTASITEMLSAATGQRVFLVPSAWEDAWWFSLTLPMNNSGFSNNEMITNKITDLVNVVNHAVKTYPLLQEVEKTKIDWNVAYRFTWNSNWVSSFVSEVVQNIDPSLIEWLLAFSDNESLKDLLQDKQQLSSIIAASILKNPLSWYFIIKEKDVVEMRIDSLQVWTGAVIAWNVWADDSATLQWTVWGNPLFTIHINSTESDYQIKANMLTGDNISLDLTLDRQWKWFSFTFNGNWAAVDAKVVLDTKNIPSYNPIHIGEPKTIDQMMEVVQDAMMESDSLWSQGVQARALTTQNKVNLNQIAQALQIYKLDGGDGQWYPLVSWFNVSSLEKLLVPSHLASLPKDPASYKWQHFGGVMSTWYIYFPIMSNGKANNGFILMAGVDPADGGSSAGWANWIDVNNQLVNLPNPTLLDAQKIKKMICSEITITDTTEDNLSKCTAKKGSTALRYLYLQE